MKMGIRNNWNFEVVKETLEEASNQIGILESAQVLVVALAELSQNIVLFIN